ncbi:hypothetical protein PYCCODRAFT_936844 [Trametes coccinea BRFM310]|uniref:Uncharacterized protein n=1 Tax=Trametes coccinea (strain BRFM310) TaxID=1353009 RepID=A0A1Y2IZD1_TRAC3|nr:hypothetical protein PYCCODRAFT_936844 [Trametes coccinea BRFM310]
MPWRASNHRSCLSWRRRPRGAQQVAQRGTAAASFRPEPPPTCPCLLLTIFYRNLRHAGSHDLPLPQYQTRRPGARAGRLGESVPNENGFAQLTVTLRPPTVSGMRVLLCFHRFGFFTGREKIITLGGVLRISESAALSLQVAPSPFGHGSFSAHPCALGSAVGGQ